MSKKESINTVKAQQLLESGYDKSKALLDNPDAFEKFLRSLEKKLRKFPIAGKDLSSVPAMVSLLKAYFEGRYKEIPVGSLIAIVSALTYFLSPIDFIPDFIPGLGQIDDVAVIGVCLKMVRSDVDDYIKWREEQGKIIDQG